MSKDGRNCMLNSSPMSKTGLTLADPSESFDLVNKTFLTDPQECTIGKRVYVGGVRSGVIAFIGETHFAPGDWVGIILDDPSGKNDGSVGGKRYFQCESKHGIFSRTNRLTLTPLSEKKSSDLNSEVDRAHVVSPSPSLESSYLRSPANIRREPIVGDRVIVSSGFGSRLGELKYLGETKFAAGTWCGIQLDEPNGKNNGSVDDVKYFDCPPKYGVFVPIAKVSLSPSMKKSSMSRMGSRESLTSIGTMNSVATTNTSRLRMSMLKKPSSGGFNMSNNKNIPKPSFSMQDIIREKQNYIEQLMNERELDREDVQNQNMHRQKMIDEMKDKIAILEGKLEKLQNTNEELRNSIEDAKFCADEMNAQNQVYKEKSILLEKKLQEVDPNAKIDYNNQFVVMEREKKECIQCTQHINENIELKHKLENMVQELQNNVKHATAKMETFNKAQLEIEELKKTIIQLESDKEFLEIEFKKLKEESLEIQQIIASQDIETNKFSTTLQNLEGKNAELMSHNLSIEKINEDLKLELENTALQCNNLKIELTEIHKGKEMHNVEFEKSKATMVGQYEKQLDALKNQNVKYEDEMKNLVNNQAIQSKETRELLEKYQEIETQNKELINKVNAQNENNEFLVSKLNNLDAQKVELEKTLTVETSKCNDLESSLNKLQAELSMKNHELDKLTQSNVELKKNNENMKSQIEKLDLEFTNIQSKYENLKLELTKSEQIQNDYIEKLEKTQKINSDFSNDIAKKNTELQEYQRIVDKLNEKLAEIKNNKILLEDKGKLVVNELTELQNSKEKLSEEYREKIHSLQEQNHDLLRQISELSKSNELSELKIKNVTTELNMKEVEFKSVCASRDLEIQKYTELLDQIDTLNNTLSAKDLQLKSTNVDMKNLNEKLTELKNVNNSLENITKALDISNKVIDEKTEECKKLEANLSSLQHENNELKTTISNVTASNTKLETEITRVTTQLSNLEVDLSSALNNHESENNEMKQLLAAHRVIKEDVAQKISELNEKNHKISELEKTIFELKNGQDAVNNLLIECKNNLATFQKQQVNETDKFELNIKSLEAVNADLKLNLDALKKDNSKLLLDVQQVTKEKLELQNKLSSALATQSSEANDLNNLKETHEYALKSVAEKDAQLIEKIQIISEQNIQIIQQNDMTDELTKELNNVQKQLSSNQNTLEEYKIIIENLKQDNSALNSQIHENSNLKTNIFEIEKCNENLQKSHTELEDQLREIETKLNATVKQLNEKDAELQSIKKRCQEIDLKYTNLNTENIQLVKDIENITKTTQVLQGKIEASESTVEEKRSELLAIESDRESQSKTVLELQSSNNNLQEILLSTKTELSDIHMKNSELEKLVEEIKNNNELLVSNLNKVSLELNETQNAASEEVNQLKSIEQSLKKENETMVTVNKSLQSSVEQLTVTSNEQYEEIKRISEKVAEFTVENDVLKTKYSSTFDLLAKTQHQVQTLQSENIEIQKASENLNIEKSELIKAEKSISDITKELEALQNENMSLSNENEQLKKNMMSVENQKHDAENNAEMLQIESEQLLDNMKNDYVNVQNELEKLKQEVVKQKSETIQSKNLVKLSNDELEIKKYVIKQLEEDLQRERLSNTVQIPQNMNNGDGDKSDTKNQINFLNSIIADMHKKNESLKSRINDLEAPSYSTNDFLQSNSLLALTKRKPAPRLFCDICDEFDAHDTEDCPSQASDSPPVSLTSRDISKIVPRKYCESCEVFGHEIGECPNDECF